jgi:hypothetical protein
MAETPRTDPSERADALGGETPVPRGSFRDRMRGKPGVGQLWRVGVFLAGLLCIAAGFALAVLPGPLTIPPVLLGLWIWSTEFQWAHRLFEKFREKGKEAWAHAKRHPVSSTVLTVGGLVLAGVAFWAVRHYALVDRAKELVGL